MKNYLTLLIAIATIAIINTSSCKKEEPKDTTKLATLSTIGISNIGTSNATTGGKITADGGAEITERGICWSELANPNINNNIIKSGKGTGSFVAEITGLSKDKTYFIKAYAKNSAGIAYGNEVSFKTNKLESIIFNGTKIFIHPTDNDVSTEWGSNLFLNATSVNDGSKNTVTIAGFKGKFTANTCSKLVAHGYTDWYLPSFGELKAIHTQVSNLTVIHKNAGAYWSSTENDKTTAYAVVFNTSSNFMGKMPKTQKNNCRCVRKEK